MEIWKAVVGFPEYEVSNKGRVKSKAREIAYMWRNKKTIRPQAERVLKPFQDELGRSRVSLWRNNIGKNVKVHHLVLEAFIGARPPKMEACHNDGGQSNNEIGNLRWDTHKNNLADEIVHGTRLRGERAVSAKLTEQNVREIRKLYKLGIENQKQLAKRFRIDPSAISRIMSGEIWSV